MKVKQPLLPLALLLSIAIRSKVLAILVLVSLTSDLSAENIQFLFTGIVDQLDTPLTEEFSTGESVVGSYFVDDTKVQYQSNRAIYSASNLAVRIGSDYTLTASAGSVIVHPNVWFLVSFSGAASGISGSPVGGSPPLYFDIQLDDSNGLLSSGVLPREYPIAQFGWDRSNINFPDDGNRLDFAVRSIDAAEVPEPSALILLATGAVGLLAYALRRRKQK